MGPVTYLPFKNHLLLHKNDSTANDEIFMENDNLENEDDIIEVDNTSNSDDFRQNGNENRTLYMFFTPTLEDLKNVLSTALSPFFEEFEIEVVSCPCLTREPYNLAAAGLSGNTGILELGSIYYFYSRPQTDIVYDIKEILSRCSYDAFVIGSGFAAQPAMPYNGHLTMNAVVSANPTNVINNSCIAYEIANHLELRIINDRNQIKCCLFGQFFFNGGKRGPVIKMRAKGRRSRSNIIGLIQAALINRCRGQALIGLGIVLVINGLRMIQLLLPHNFIMDFYGQNDYYHGRLIPHFATCRNLIALGALFDRRCQFFKDHYERVYLRHECSIFNVFCNELLGGEFWNDDASKETEYIVYINIAQERCCYY